MAKSVAVRHLPPYHPRNAIAESDMSFGQAVSTCFSKYATFAGRARRPEYWYWVLFGVVASIVLAIIDLALPFNVLTLAFDVATLLPGLAVLIRRLHDTDHSGWWWLIGLIPVIGWILLLVWVCTRGTDGPNRFGPAPA
jgi:uncharacterized membrane protein YhaH (DUF805 family)